MELDMAETGRGHGSGPKGTLLTDSLFQLRSDKNTEAGHHSPALCACLSSLPVL